MKAARLTALREMEICDVPDPVIKNPHDVLLKIERVGVCGSDVHYYTTGRIGSQIVKFPFTVGHECSATVVEVGSAVTSVKAGDAVAVEPLNHCHECDQCKAGRPHTCRNQTFLGCPGQAEGCLSEYLVMKDECCLKLPRGMSLEDGALVEPMAIGLYAVKLSGLKPGARICINGLGPIGLSVLSAAQAFGVGDVFATEPLAERLELGLSAGITAAVDPYADGADAELDKFADSGFDIVFECAGKQESLDNCLSALGPGGKAMLIGIPEFDRYSFKADITRRRELCLQQVRRQNGCAEECIELMAAGKMVGSHMVTHRMPFAETKKAFDLIAGYEDGAVKIMLEF